MMLTRWNLPNLSTQMERLFSDLLESEVPQRQSQALPPLNVLESEGAYHVELSVPGWSLDDLEILLDENELSVSGERKEEVETPEGAERRTWHRREFATQSFRRALRLPADVDRDKIDARLEHGVLQIDLPKAEQSKPRRIAVTNGK